MKKRKNNKTMKNIIFVIVAFLLVIAIIGGGTYAYWQWYSPSNQATNVNVTISRPNFEIVANTMTSSNMMPVSSCYSDGSNTTIAGKATVTALNNTTTTMYAKIRLKAKVSASIGTVAPQHIHWAIIQVDLPSQLFSASYCANNTSSDGFDIGTFAQMGSQKNLNIGTSFQDIYTTIQFEVAPSATATVKNYQVYVWIDEGYEEENYGTVVSDPLQDKTITVTFSENSIFTQDPGR